MRKLFLASIIGLLSVVASAQNWTGSNKTINSGDLRFGNGSELSINYTGNVQQPFYNSAGNWYKLTYSSYPLDYEIASGGNGSSSYNRNGSIVLNPTMTNQVFDHSGFIITSGSTGYGTLKVKGNITVGSDLLEVTFSYYIANPNDNFCKITTSIKNVGSATATNLRYWVGTRDDYVGVYDSNTKTKGNIINGVFTQIPTAATQSKALRISNGSDAVLFYTTSPLANMSHASCCSFSNSTGINPTSSAITASGDGSYAMFIRLPDLGIGQTQTFDWFYAAGSMAEIAQIAAQVASASIGVNNITTNSANLAAFSSNSGTGYYLVVPAGSQAPTAAEIIAGGNYGSVTIATSGSGPLTANTTNDLSMPGLSPLTNYTVYFVSQYMNNSVLTTGAIANQDFTTLFSCGEIHSRVDGSAQGTQCAGVSGTPVNNSVIGTAYINAPTTVKTSSIRYKWSAATFPSIVPVISSVWVNGISSAMQVGPPSVSINAAGEYFVDYCFYNVNLPVTGTYSLRFINPLTGNEVGICTYDADDNGPTVTPVLVPNVMPTVSSISNINLPCAASATSPISFTVSDLETAAGDLIVSATSSNTNLIPNANLVLTQPNSSGAASLSYSVASGQVGSSIITISVLDHLGGIGTRTFTVDVSSATAISMNNSLCGSNGLQWMTMTNISPASASGVGQNGITVAITQSGSGMINVNGMYQANQFPGIYNVPTSGATIANQFAGNFQACFSQPVVNPVVAFSSIGNPSNCVPIIVSQPYSVVWTGQNMTYTSPTQMTGCEGKTIIRLDGTVSCVDFNYLASEYYCTVAFGFENQNCYTPTICSGNSVTLNAGLSSDYVWTPATGLNTTTGASVIASPTTTTTYTVSSLTDACASPTSVTVVVNETPTITTSVANTEVSITTTIPSQAFTSNVPGTTFSWTNSNTAIGLGASGTGTIPSFVAQNNTSSPITSTITVTPISPSLCVGTPLTYTITVISIPNVNPPSNVVNCEGSSTTVDFTGTTPNTNYLWTNSNPAIGLPASGTNDLSFISQNLTNVAQTATIVVTPQMFVTEGYVWGSVNENGTLILNAPAGKVFTTVDFASYGTPNAPVNGNYTLGSCHASTSSSVIEALAIGNNTMSVAANNATFGDPCATSSKALAVKIGYGVSLTGIPQTFTITVNPSASIANSTDTICTGTPFTFAVNPSDIVPSNTSYTWTAVSNNNITGETDQATPNAVVSQVLFNATSIDQTASYTITPISGAAGCVGSPFTYNVTVTPLPTTITAFGPTTFCDGGSVVLGAPVAPLQMAYTYQWNLNGAPIPGATSISYIANTSGDYTVTVTNNLGCSAISQAMVVTENPLPVIGAIAGSTAFCIGSTTALSSTTTGGVWSTSNTATATVNASSGLVTGISPGIASISYTVTDLNGCVNSLTTIVTVNAYPVVAAITGSSSVCAGSSALFENATSGGVWSSSNTAIATVSTTGNVTGISTGQATITYTVTNGAGCASSVSATINVNALPSPIITPLGATTFCNTGTVELSSSPGVSYLWSNGEQTQSIVVSTTGSFYVTVTNAAGCSATSVAIGITMNGTPVVEAITGATNVCTGLSTTLESATLGGVWSSSNAAIASVSASGVVTGVSAGQATITYTVTSGAGCVATVSANVNVNALPTPTITASGATAFCAGGTVTLTSSPASSYLWSNGEQTQSITVAASGTYYVTVTNAAGCSATSVNTNTTMYALPTVNAIAGANDVCVGSTEVLSNATNGGVWSSNNASIAAISSNGIVTGISAGVATITYTVTNSNGCTDAVAFNMIVNANPILSPITGTAAVCLGSTTTLANAQVGGSWSSSDVAIATIAENGVVTGLSVGSATISYTYTNVAGCTSSISQLLTVNALPVATIFANTPTTFCPGDSVTLSATPSMSAYLWSTGAPTATITTGSIGLYTVTITDANGCSSTSAPTSVDHFAVPVATIASTGSNVCLGSTVTLTASGGATYSWSNGATSASIDVTAANDYTVTVTSIHGCSASTTETVVFNANPAVTINANGPTVFCEGGSLTLTASGGSIYVWNNGDQGATTTLNQSGAYYVTVTNAAGCTTQSSLVNVTVNALPVVATITGGNTVCEGSSLSLTSSTLGGVWTSANNFIATIDANGMVTGLNSGSTVMTYTVTNNGCSAAVSAMVNVLNNPVTPSVSASGSTSVCPGSTVVLFASNASNYQWNTGATTPFIVATQSGSYDVTVTGLNGCSATSLPIQIFIGDDTNPVISAPLNVTVTPNLGCEAIGVTLGSPITSDNCSVASVSNNAPAIYPIGTTIVTWTVTDASGNEATATQLVTVVDQTAPSAIAPANVTVLSNNNCEAVAVELGLPNIADNCTQNLEVSNNAPSIYPLGNTIVTWTIIDGAGNTTTVEQTVTVVDQTTPVVLLASTTVILDGNGYATLDFSDLDNGSYDNCGIASAVLSQSEFDCSNVGMNFITVTLTDNSGNQAFAVVMITVVASDACGGDNWSGPSVPDAFTPNGNNYNDTWVIPGLEGYNTKEITVYSRYGTLVYYSSIYNNDWDGTLLNTGTPVPDGTYYYILNLDGGKQLNGFVYINRVKQ